MMSAFLSSNPLLCTAKLRLPDIAPLKSFAPAPSSYHMPSSSSLSSRYCFLIMRAANCALLYLVASASWPSATTKSSNACKNAGAVAALALWYLICFSPYCLTELSGLITAPTIPATDDSMSFFLSLTR